ncbi:unnamed protein product [Darwinula stevensoni]|uniref:cholesterol 7-desaturase n=1 Tax=Darwinula stevensoni TaxID=69355 RepID=A0A7R9ADL0_9CRUS|nr:unnamed protein product [Darwinula stevensoni]CAG0901216.1 unnamed protein product [Darwinula stevensoni]
MERGVILASLEDACVKGTLVGVPRLVLVLVAVRSFSSTATVPVATGADVVVTHREVAKVYHHWMTWSEKGTLVRITRHGHVLVAVRSFSSPATALAATRADVGAALGEWMGVGGGGWGSTAWRLGVHGGVDRLLGMNLALFRTESGVACVTDAYCPHLGANMGVGGRVVGECIECPFHAWLFQGSDGKCSYSPYTDKAPTFAKVKTHLVDEAIGYIWIWFHSEGVEPTYRIPRLPEIHEQNWKYMGRTEHYVNVHIQDIAENGADMAHFTVVHGPVIAMGSDLRKAGSSFWKAIHHTWNATWAPLPHPEGHVGHLDVVQKLSFFDKFFTMTVKGNLDMVGPSLVIMRLSGAAIGDVLIVHSVTPVGPLMQRLIHRVYTSRTWMAPIAKLFLFVEAINILERDMMVWNNKRFEKNPLLVKEERPIQEFRRWYSQFYSENSPKFEFSNKLDMQCPSFSCTHVSAVEERKKTGSTGESGEFLGMKSIQSMNADRRPDSQASRDPQRKKGNARRGSSRSRIDFQKKRHHPSMASHDPARDPIDARNPQVEFEKRGGISFRK